ncbi:MAG TPA: zinc ribbon domain-containing protein [bacterium]|nr:zinc ribbon domain-containing protein [bacterium]
MNQLKFIKAVCQSCGSPLLKESDRGTEKGGSFTDTYCRRCYRQGIFTEPQMTAEEMRESVRRKMMEMRFPRFLAVLLSNRVYALKRWEGVKP